MNNNNLIEPIEIALKMEKEGYEFYIDSLKKVSNKSIKQILISLAKDEEEHICVFRNIFNSIKNFSKLPDDILIDSSRENKIIFDKTNKEKIINAKQDIDIIKIAQKMENESIKYYQNLSAVLIESKMKNFFIKLVEIEKHHFDILDNTYEYLKSQTDWYTKEEKPSFEG